MDIQNEKLKVTCPSCGDNIIITYRTESCPKCNLQFNPDYIHKIFHDYETRLLNNKVYQAGGKLEKVGNTTQNVGNAMSRVGCFLTLFVTIPIVFILLLLLL